MLSSVTSYDNSFCRTKSLPTASYSLAFHHLDNAKEKPRHTLKQLKKTHGIMSNPKSEYISYIFMSFDWLIFFCRCNNYMEKRKCVNIQVSLVSQISEPLIYSPGFDLCKIKNMMAQLASNERQTSFTLGTLKMPIFFLKICVLSVSQG